MLKNTAHSYGSMSKFLHWIIALFILFMLTSGYFTKNFPLSWVPFVFNAHKLLGLLILALIIFKVFWRIANPAPPLPPLMTRFEKILAHSVQNLLYLAVILLPFSGWMMVSAAGHAPKIGSFILAMPGIAVNHLHAGWFYKIHSATALTLLVLLSLHILGAFKHYFIDRDGVLQRMLPRFFHRQSAKKIK